VTPFKLCCLLLSDLLIIPIMYFLVYCVNLDLQDFENALQEVRPSVSSTELGIYEEWNRQFGSLSI
jgi:hypothetical protein